MIAIVELPDENELVLAVIKKIMPYGAFCVLPEYNNLEAFLHVSEVAPRWIKNIHEFISEGQRYVVKVHHVDLQKNQVDVSLKRVNEEEKKQKLELVKSEKRGERLFEVAMKDSGLKLDPKVIRSTIETEFGDLFSCFKEASLEGETALKGLDVPKELKAAIIEMGKKNIKKPVVEVNGIVTLVCYGPAGVDDIKKALTDVDAEMHYLGAPRYKLSITAPDYKAGEKKLLGAVEHIKGFAQKHNCDFKFDRE